MPPIQQGWNQATPAMQSVFSRGIGRPGTRRKAVRAKLGTSTKRVKRKVKARAARAAGKPARLVKGSAAAKRYMAKLRAMVKRRR